MELCEICQTREATAWDHDHDTGLIRGRLCSPCNTGIGGLNDDPELLRRAIEYLERPPTDVVFAEMKRERQRLAVAKWREEHRELERERKRKAYADDPERFREVQRRWKRDDADGEKKRRSAENRRKWMEEHPGKAEEYEANRREAQRLDRLEQGRARYRRDMADPEKKEKELERLRQYKRQKKSTP